MTSFSGCTELVHIHSFTFGVHVTSSPIHIGSSTVNTALQTTNFDGFYGSYISGLTVVSPNLEIHLSCVSKYPKDEKSCIIFPNLCSNIEIVKVKNKIRETSFNSYQFHQFFACRVSSPLLDVKSSLQRPQPLVLRN